MVKNIPSQVRPEWPTSSQSGVRKRKETKTSYQPNLQYFHQNNFLANVNPVSPLEHSSSRPNLYLHQPSNSPPIKPELLEYIDYQNSSTASFNFQPNEPPELSAWCHSSTISYTLPSHPPNSPQSPENGFSPMDNRPAHVLPNNPQVSWPNNGTPTPALFNNEMSVVSPSNSHFGSFDSFNSLGMASVHTAPSSISDTYTCPETHPNFTPSERPSLIQDLSLSGEYYDARQSSFNSPYDPSPTSSNTSNSSTCQDMFPIDEYSGDYMMQNWNTSGPYSVSTMTMTQVTQPPHVAQNSYVSADPVASHSPWNAMQHDFSVDQDGNAGCEAFEPPRGQPYDIFLRGEQAIEQASGSFVTGPGSPALESENEWLVVPSYPSSSIRSHESPHSEASWTHVDAGSPLATSESPQSLPDNHSHVFSAYPGLPSPKHARGRQRALTSQEKKEALDVRKAKACWACHLSKIKCSPCSPGSPCQQCERLSGKRRFCWLDCFNDPLESLRTFLAPDYTYSKFTQGAVEAFISKNATSWGNYEMTVSMSWGYREPLQARVVTLKLCKDSQLAWTHGSIAHATEKTQYFKRLSPPIGVPLASMQEMEEEYCTLVQDIVRHDAMNYVEVAYGAQESDLPERLLQTIASFYSAGLAAGDEVDILRQALEVHVVETIMERNLSLDRTSLQQVQRHLGLVQEFAPNSASRCLQRQMKLAFYGVQQKRIFKVLETWGSMMWTSNKNTAIDKKWTTSFSVLLCLILVIDKALESASYFCENQIRHHNANPRIERAKYYELVRLTHTEVFERCKEIFHSSFKTRKGGKEACNPIRDGNAAFRGKTVNEGISRLVWDLGAIMRDFGPEIKAQKGAKPDESLLGKTYTNAGRLASIFLADFLDH